MGTEVRIEDGTASLYTGSRRRRASVSEAVLVRQIARFFSPPPDFFPAHGSVRFHEWEGQNAVLVVELEPAVRSLRWIADLQEGLSLEASEAVHLGANAQYEKRELALPWVVLMLSFSGGVLQGSSCQAFYRRESLKSWDDELLYTNLLNVAEGYGFTSWLCMVQYRQTEGLSWLEAIEEAVRYFLWSDFNRSSEIHERNSHFSTTIRDETDERVLSVQRWEEASGQDALFMTQIAWPATGHTVRSAVNLSLSHLPSQILNLANLVQAGE